MKSKDFFSFYNEYIQALKTKKQDPSADLFKYTLRAYLKRVGEKMDSNTVQMFVGRCRMESLSEHSIAGYVRNLKTVWKLYAKKYKIVEDPFEGLKTSAPPQTEKMPLLENEVEILRSGNLPKELEKYRDLWLFSYNTMGMRLKDVLFLQKSNIVNGHISYKMSKNDKWSMVKISPEAQQILDRNIKEFSPFIFQIVKAPHGYAQYKNAKSLVFKKLKKIEQILDLQSSLSAHIARHTFASKIQDLDIQTIQAALNHSSPNTTMNYMNGFNRKKKMDTIIDNFFSEI